MLSDTQPRTKPQLLLDLSVLVGQDDKSGIQRVVRSVLTALRQAPPAGYRIEAVYDRGGHYAYARRHTSGDPEAEDEPVALRAGDVFLGLDLAPNHVPGNRAIYEDMRRHGVAVYFVVYDLLPVTHPAMFHPGAAPWFTRWLETVGGVADGLLCISRAVADDLLAWLEQARLRRDGALQVGYFHLGADLDASLPSSGITEAEHAMLAGLGTRPTLLMVGTLEPRKMHAQALDAAEQLWRDDVDVNLVIIGKPGWMTEALAARLEQHAEAGARLFWLPRASDETLQQLYRRASGLLAPSVAEGFGLPLIEAAQYGLPLIARDIPVFREVCGEHAYYFQARDGAQLAQALQQWLALHAQGAAPASHGMPWLTWAQSSAQLLQIFTNQQWYRMATTVLA